MRLSEVLEHHGVHVEIDTGSEKKALCPFHMDNTIGSFSINDAKGICKCFACGGGGDAIHSMMQLNDMSYKDALLQLAADEQIISKKKFKELSQREYSDEFIKGMEGPAEKMTSVKSPKLLSLVNRNVEMRFIRSSKTSVDSRRSMRNISEKNVHYQTRVLKKIISRFQMESLQK